MKKGDTPGFGARTRCTRQVHLVFTLGLDVQAKVHPLLTPRPSVHIKDRLDFVLRPNKLICISINTFFTHTFLTHSLYINKP